MDEYCDYEFLDDSENYCYDYEYLEQDEDVGESGR
jgi:hypothetical protein